MRAKILAWQKGSGVRCSSRSLHQRRKDAADALKEFDKNIGFAVLFGDPATAFEGGKKILFDVRNRIGLIQTRPTFKVQIQASVV